MDYDTINLSLFLSVVEATCPSLISLDFFRSAYYTPSLPPSPSVLAGVEGHDNMQPFATLKPKHLRHFRCQLVEVASSQTRILDIVTRQSDTLTSVDIRTGSLNFTLNVCGLIPNLKSLALSNTKGDALEYFEKLSMSPSTANLERFSIRMSGLQFSATFGLLFRSWKKLTFLQIGDRDDGGGPFIADDGELDFGAYQQVR